MEIVFGQFKNLYISPAFAHGVYISQMNLMQQLALHTISFYSRQTPEKQVDAAGVSAVLFTDSFPQILRSLQ
jgi:hypothetical protein